MRRFWWSWDIRMRWSFGFSHGEESYVRNYKRAIDAARRYKVEGIIVWGFLRDSHGGIDAAKQIRDYAGEQGVKILPGVGVDDYGGVYYEGSSPYSLDSYLKEHPSAQARKEDGSPATHRWPPTDATERRKGCPSDEGLLEFYRISLEWLIETFDLDGFQIEQGDSGLCYCNRCRAKPRTTAKDNKVSLSESAERIAAVVRPILAKRRSMTILSETYVGLTPETLKAIGSHLAEYPEEVILSWQIYDSNGRYKITEGIRSPRPHGNAALRTNNDLRGGELDDTRHIARALNMAKAAGLDSTYIYGEYPDDWPLTRKNYEVWAISAHE